MPAMQSLCRQFLPILYSCSHSPKTEIVIEKQYVKKKFLSAFLGACLCRCTVSEQFLPATIFSKTPFQSALQTHKAAMVAPQTFSRGIQEYFHLLYSHLKKCRAQEGKYFECCCV